MSRAPDIDNCYAQLELANKQIGQLEVEISTFLATEPYAISDEYLPATLIRRFELFFDADVPKGIPAGITSVLASQRATLDYLAVALARRNGAEKLSDCYFPICDSLESFKGAQAQGKIKRLSQADQSRIADVRPYRGGNDGLYFLHWLNNIGKHRRPIAIFDVPAISQWGIKGSGYCRRITGYGPENTLLPGRSFIDLDADGGVTLEFKVELAFGEIEQKFTPPIIPTLRSFSFLVRSIVDRF